MKDWSECGSKIKIDNRVIEKNNGNERCSSEMKWIKDRGTELRWSMVGIPQ
jgi:hypothetical protein